MSYDFVLFRVEDGADPRALANDEVAESGPRDAACEAAKRKLANALIADDPHLSEHVFDYDEIATLHRMPVETAYERFRYIELSDLSPGGSGAQITLFDDRATVTVPYWHADSASAHAQLQRVWSYIDVVCRESGYEVFDVQLDRLISSSAFDEVFVSYAQSTARVRSFNASTRRRPWWKFW
jgi:hypothetical protein